jgi:ABC-type lipoprotein export system ATPase subunit
MKSYDSVISAEGLTKVYENGENKVFALKGIDLSPEEGEMLAVMGSSGSGKSTLLNIIGALDSPTEGRVYIKGNEAKNLSSHQVPSNR